jgi:hypothetical protein
MRNSLRSRWDLVSNTLPSRRGFLTQRWPSECKSFYSRKPGPRGGPFFEPLRIGALLDHTFAVVIGSPVIKSGTASGR